MVASLRNIGKAVREIAREGPCAGLPVDPRVESLLDQFWPECFEDSKGNVVMAKSDVDQLEAMYAMFGVPLKVSQNSLTTLGYAYDLFVLRLKPFVRARLTHPDTFTRFVGDWPEDWVRYVDAVATLRLDEARAIAKKLQPLSPDCPLPPDVERPELPKPPTE